jgi:hypothetical protein
MQDIRSWSDVVTHINAEVNGGEPADVGDG